MKFRHAPTTVVVTDRVTRKDEVWVGNAADFGPSVGLAAPFALTLFARGEEKVFPVGSAANESHDELELIGSEEGSKIVVRAYQPEDATRSITIDTDFALPSAVAAMMVSDEAGEGLVSTQPTLEALVDDNGFVSTLLLVSDAGLYARYDSQWIPLQSTDPIDGLSVYELKPEALEFYDQYDQVGQSIHIGSMPVTDEEAAERPVVIVDEALPIGGDVVVEELTQSPAEEPAEIEVDVTETEDEAQTDPLAASGAGVMPAELEAMVSAGVKDPDVRWVAERRAKSMGYDGPLPWDGPLP